MNLTDEMLESLSDAQYGASETWKVEDTDLIVRVMVEIDEHYSVMDDGDWYGRLEWGRENDYGPVRPDGMTGRAEIIRRDYRDQLWWEPPADITDLDAFRSELRDLLEYGFVGIVAELCEETDAYGRPVAREVASLWGISSMASDADKREVVLDLLIEMGFQDDYDEPRS